MLSGALVTAIFGSTDTEHWAIKARKDNSLDKDNYAIND